MGVPMEGFFDGVDVAFTTPTPSTAASKVPTKTSTPSAEPVPREEGTHTEGIGIGEATPLSAETLAPPERTISPTAIQSKTTSPILPLVISTSDPFAALSQAAKDSASLVVTPFSIPSSATRGPDTDLSSEGSDDILEDPDDAPILKKRISDFEESAPPEPDFMGMCLLFVSIKFTLFFLSFLRFICMPISLLAKTFEGPGVAAGIGMPTPAIPIVPIPVVPSASASAVPTVLVFAIPAGLGKFPFPFIFFFFF